VESNINCFTNDVAAEQDVVRNYSADIVNVSRFLDQSLWDTIKYVNLFLFTTFFASFFVYFFFRFLILLIFRHIVAPGGFIVFHTFMESCTKPRRPQFKLKVVCC
jgi:hypothetical protein